MDCSPPGSSVHGIFQARVLEWAPLPSLNTIFRGVLTPEGCNAQMKGVGMRRNIIQSIATCISKQSQTKLLCNANGSLHTPSSKWRSPKYECESLGSTCLLILSVLVFFFFPLPLYIHFKIFTFLVPPCSMWDLRTLSRDQTCASSSGNHESTTEPPRNYPISKLLFQS